jgi:ABC-type transport system involved in multi-copper enzyme maturation permease subunit
MLGMADGDLYFLENDPVPSPSGFAQNYFKAAFGLWCRICLVVGLAVCCSTYLSGVIAFLAAAFLFMAGFFSDHLADMATGKSFAGGPVQAITQLLEAKSSTTPLDQSNPITKVALGGDAAFSWVMRRFINLVPDVDAFSWTQFVAEGFNIPFEYLIMNFVVLVGYLLPWFVLGFYLMRSREVAA